MAAINDLIEQIEDEGLRQRINEELRRLLKQKKFGLVFEEHQPEGLTECKTVRNKLKSSSSWQKF